MIPQIDGIYTFITFLVVLLLILIVRYFLTAGIFVLYFYKIKKNKWQDYKLSKNCKPPRKQFYKEIKWSLITSVIFAFVGVLTLLLYQNGYTVIYTSLSEYSYLWLPASLIIAMFIHETYYYWAHRWMHHPKIFKKVHKVHHDSIVPSPWTAFSFHPWEGLLEAIILPLILMIIPMHPVVILFYLLLMTVSSAINHLDIEIYPDSFQKSRIGKLIIGASHHHYHHSEFKTNYGLYFTFWDKWMNTESKAYNSREL